jgi:hypothetical protein
MNTQNNMTEKTLDQHPDNHVNVKIAKMAAGLLNENAQNINTVASQRLTTARNLAVNALASRQTQASQGVHQSGNVLQWLGHGFGAHFGQHRAMSAAMMAGVVMLTFFATQQFNHTGLNNLESGDAFLLASELPPEAFADKGFDTWVVSKRD